MIEEEWFRFLQRHADNDKEKEKGSEPAPAKRAKPASTWCGDNPLFGELMISTNTKQVFLNKTELDISYLFWALPVMAYWHPKEGVVKKQMKMVSNSVEEYDALMAKIRDIHYCTETVMKQINNPQARKIKFRDHRKLTVGVSRKDIMNSRGKKKKAFDNCFAMILRFLYHGKFREIHVKVFATGKMEIPGILNEEILTLAKEQILSVLQPHVDETLCFVPNTENENVLINSGFHCGFFINRSSLFTILRSEKYNLETSFDSCIYPGIKCRFYYNNQLPCTKEAQRGVIDAGDRKKKVNDFNGDKKYTEVSFMIFRTGKILIVGNCNEPILRYIYSYICDMLKEEYENIVSPNEVVIEKVVKAKKRKRNIWLSLNRYKELARSE
jgi:TATA-box binding protein (TBP) (component of TFIID and TFIIIB)